MALFHTCLEKKCKKKKSAAGKNLLDGRYAEFGYTTNNAELLADVKEGDIIKSAKIISGKENWKASA